MKKYHWTQRWGRNGSYLGVLNKKLLDDHQTLLAQVTSVAVGCRAHVQIHDGGFHDYYWARSVDVGCNMVQQFFTTN